MGAFLSFTPSLTHGRSESPLCFPFSHLPFAFSYCISPILASAHQRVAITRHEQRAGRSFKLKKIKKYR